MLYLTNRHIDLCTCINAVTTYCLMNRTTKRLNNERYSQYLLYVCVQVLYLLVFTIQQVHLIANRLNTRF